LKDPDTYQPFSPEIIGRNSARLVLGCHSGGAVIKHVMEKAGVVLSNETTRQLLTCMRAEVRRKRAPLSPGELVRLYQRLSNQEASPNAWCREASRQSCSTLDRVGC
jgi:homocitrate synthase NifV